jgi:uncharacterized damage-inducible protein DinB
MDILDRFLEHNAWATMRLIEQSRSLTELELDQQFDIGLRTVRATTDHIIENIEWWTDLMNAAPPRTFENLGEDPMTLDGFAKRLAVVTAEFANVARLKQAHGQLDDHWPERIDQTKSYTYCTTVVHVLTHAAHHRGQWMYMLKRLGVRDVIVAQALSLGGGDDTK